MPDVIISRSPSEEYDEKTNSIQKEFSALV
jgi:hypothetical protein